MVHLAQIPNDSEVTAPLVEGLKNIRFESAEEGPGDYSTSVYGSRYAAADLPRHEMPDHEMPKDM